MEERSRIQSVNGGIHPPEAIIQHIQSFLSGKEAAQTSILSKSWYSAWSTRPNLDFDQRDFRNACFWKFVEKTMRRYEDLNLKIESFRLRTWWGFSPSLVEELVVKAMKMGALDLELELHCHDGHTGVFALPREVLGSKNLVRLCVSGCKIDGKVSFSRLKSLSLHNVYVQGDVIWDIISRCPLIEELLLSQCGFLLESQNSNVVSGTSGRLIALSPFIELGNYLVLPVVDGLINLHELRKLRVLFLGDVFIEALFFHDLSSRFPCLKDLTIDSCFGYKEIKICSTSLECITFKERKLEAEFDVPSIRKFSFSGSSLPSLSFATTSREWESCISICCDRLTSPWFLGLRECLTNLSQSKISLSLTIGFMAEFSVDFRGLPKPVVKNLMLSVHRPSAALLDCLFCSCRPKFVYLMTPGGEIGDEDLLELFCKTVTREVSVDCYMPNRYMFGLSDLEEVKAEAFEERLAEWQHLPLKALMDALASPENKRKIRFQLRWG